MSGADPQQFLLTGGHASGSIEGQNNVLVFTPEEPFSNNNPEKKTYMKIGRHLHTSNIIRHP